MYLDFGSLFIAWCHFIKQENLEEAICDLLSKAVICVKEFIWRQVFEGATFYPKISPHRFKDVILIEKYCYAT